MAAGENALSSDFGAALLDHIVQQPWDSSQFAEGPEGLFAVGTSKGPVRERNDDRAAVVQFVTPGLPNVFLFGVFDGVGGSRDGGVAASIALAATIEAFASGSKGSLADLLESSLRHADHAVYSALLGSGLSTASVVVLGPRSDFYAANVGDSRIYAWDSATRTLTQISEDDTLLSALERNNVKLESQVVRARGLEGSLSQALGERRTSSDELRVDVKHLEPSTPGVLVASDGAWSSASFDVNHVVSHASTGPSVVSRLIDVNEWLGGRDNLTVVACSSLAERSSASVPSPRRRTIRVWLPSGSATFISPERHTAPTDEQGGNKRKRGKRGSKRDSEENVFVEEDATGESEAVERFPEPQVQD